MATQTKKSSLKQIPKVRTGISGLDEITFGGIPKGKATLIAGGAGSGKTLLACEIALAGILDYNENAVIMAFEETESDLTQNLASLGYDLPQLVTQKKLVVDHVIVFRSEFLVLG